MHRRAWWPPGWRGWLQIARLFALAVVAIVALGEVDYTRISGEYAYPTGEFSLSELFMWDQGPWRGPLAWFIGGLVSVIWSLAEGRHRWWAEGLRLALAMSATAAFFAMDIEILSFDRRERLVGAFLADLSVTIFFAASIAIATVRPRQGQTSGPPG